ncbi:VCBS repeat-containing protein [Shimia sp.]|uniref:FG-GAP repeat domain-containing protein n=1 Tax=Shimia sp. TaxID=1954381 RepID=UPI003296CFD4
MLRAVIIAAALLAGPVWAGPQNDREILSATYADPTGRYAHGVLGDAVEWGTLTLYVDTCPACARIKTANITITLPDTHVFEDIAPRLADVDNDGAPEVIVVETNMSKGAALAIYDETGKVAQTPYIGRSNRWLAPLGAADLDGDGKVELAYIDRPHLARTLRVWRFDNGRLVHVADKKGLTNHRIGEDFISGGIRDCNGKPEMVTVNSDWSRIMVTELSGKTLTTRDAGPFKSKRNLENAMKCRN